MKMRALKAGIATLMSLMMVANVGLGVVYAEDPASTGSAVVDNTETVTVTFQNMQYSGEPVWVQYLGQDIQILKFTPDGETDVEYAVITGAGSTIKHLNVPNELNGATVVGIGDGAFKGNTTLEVAQLPRTIDTIGKSAFEGCTSLLTVYIPNIAQSEIPLTTIEDNAFMGCTNLASVECEGAEETLDWIGKSAFEGCDNLYIVPALVYTNNSVRCVEDRAFRNCKKLPEIYGGLDLSYVGTEAFCGCTGLTKVALKGRNLKIGSTAFGMCKSLETADLYSCSNLYDLPFGVFMSCDNLTNIYLPKESENLTSIGFGAFQNCTSLESIDIPDNITYIADFAFDGCTSLVEVNDGIGVTNTSHLAFQSTPWMNEQVEAGIASGDPVILGYVLLNWWWAEETAQVPRTIKLIGREAFNNNTILRGKKVNIERVYIPSSVKAIHASAFKDITTLKSVTGGENVVSIMEGAFSGCENLVIIEPLDSESILYLDHDALADTYYLEDLKANTDGLIIVGNTLYDINNIEGKIVVPEGVRSVNNNALDCNTARMLIMPSTLEIIEEGTLNGATALHTLVLQSDVTTAKGLSLAEGTTDLTVYNASSNTASSNSSDNYLVALRKQYNNTKNPAKLTIRNGLPAQGDVNNDGYMRVNDLVTIRKYLVGMEDTGINLDFADVNNDGNVNVFDFVVMKRLWLQGE